jgi:indole-3-glycerol phosphate synthase
LTGTVPDILARIVARKREELARGVPRLDQWEAEAELRLGARRDFRAALGARTPAIIAEIKKASPSKGVLSADFDAARIASAYQRGGASALSVLTDETFFQGSLGDLESARAAVSLPVLRKDFTIARAQIVEAAAHGADAILLIAAILTEREIREFPRNCRALPDGRAGGSAQPPRTGCRHGRRQRHRRSKQSRFDHLRGRSRNVVAARGAHSSRVLCVSESGIHDARDIATLREAGYTAFLVGEHLMKSGDPAAALKELVAA